MSMIEYDIGKFSRRCAATNRELEPGEEFYSVLIREGADYIRLDYSRDAWQGPPPGAVGWWKSRVSTPGSPRRRWAPSDVMLHYWQELENLPEQQDLRYVLTLLLIRRGILCQERMETDRQGQSSLIVYSAKEQKEFRVNMVLPTTDERTREIQRQISKLLQ